VASVEIRSGTLALVGADRIAAGTALVLDGGTLDLGRTGGQAFASLSLLDDSTIDFGDGKATVTFHDIGAIVAGKALRLLADQDRTDPLLRFTGDVAKGADFQALLRVLQVVGNDTGTGKLAYDYDGRYTNIVAGTVPEPGSAALFIGGICLLGALRRRRSGASAGARRA
jgi:hypothetical protein